MPTTDQETNGAEVKALIDDIAAKFADREKKEAEAVKLTEKRDAEIQRLGKATEETAKALDAKAAELAAADKERKEQETERDAKLATLAERLDTIEAGKAPNQGGDALESAADRFLASEYLKRARDGNWSGSFEISKSGYGPSESKTLLQTDTLTPQVRRESLVIPEMSNIPLVMRDLIPAGFTEREGGTYWEETGFWSGTPQAATGITRVGSVATLTMAAAHGFGSIGESHRITVAGANQAEYNGTFLATITSATVVTYTVSGAPTTPATGTITAYKNFGQGAAAPVSEGGTLAEAQYEAVLRSWQVHKIGHMLPMTKEAMDDNSELRNIIENRLAYGLSLAENRQILSGSGVAPNLFGILVRSNILSYLWSSGKLLPVPDTKIDAVRRGLTRMMISEYEPDGLVMHPFDWEDIVLAKGTDGHYLAITAIDSAGFSRFFNLPVVRTKEMPVGTVLGGNFRMAAELKDRQAIEISFTDSHSTYFAEDKFAIKATERVGLVIKRPEAFVNITLDAEPS